MYIKELMMNDESMKLLFAFTIKNNHTWKNQIKISLLRHKIKPPEQDNINDYEYFVNLEQIKEKYELYTKRYLLIDNNTPIALIQIIINEKRADINLIVLEEYQKQNIPKIVLPLLEDILFKNLNIKEITITDLTNGNDLGYSYSPTENLYVKENPNTKHTLKREIL